MFENISQSEAELAIKRQDRLLEFNPMEHNSMVIKAKALMRLSDLTGKAEKLDEAIELYNKAIDLKQKDVGYLTERAKLFVKMGNPAAAAEDIKEASEYIESCSAIDKAFVTNTAKELARLDEVKIAIDKIRAVLPPELSFALDELRGVSANLITVQCIDGEKICLNSKLISELFEKVNELDTKFVKQDSRSKEYAEEIAAIKTLTDLHKNELSRMGIRMETVEQRLTVLEKTFHDECIALKDVINQNISYSQEEKAIFEGKLSTLQDKISHSSANQELIQAFVNQIRDLNSNVVYTKSSIDVINLQIDAMNSVIEEHSREIQEIDKTIVAINQKLEDSLVRLPNIEMLPLLLQGKAEEVASKEEFTILHKDRYTAGIYDSIRFQLNAVYNAASVVETGIIGHKMSGKVGIIGKIMKSFGDKMPVVGGAVSLLGTLISHVDKNKQDEKLSYFASLATNDSDMDLLADSIARQIASAELNKAKLHDSVGFMDKLSQNCTEAFTKSKKKVEEWIKHQKMASTQHSAYEEGTQDGNIIAAILVCKLFKGELLGKDHSEIATILSAEVIITYQDLGQSPSSMTDYDNGLVGNHYGALPNASDHDVKPLGEQTQDTFDAKWA